VAVPNDETVPWIGAAKDGQGVPGKIIFLGCQRKCLFQFFNYFFSSISYRYLTSRATATTVEKKTVMNVSQTKTFSKWLFPTCPI